MRKKTAKKENLSGKAEVDVSGLLADTKDTVFAFANGESFAILVTGKTKRTILQAYRESKNRPKDFPLHFYIAGIKILFGISGKKFTSVVLDREVSGHEHKIEMALGSKFVSLVIKSVGRSSPAHYLAYGVHSGRKKADKIISEDKFILEMGLGTKN